MCIKNIMAGIMLLSLAGCVTQSSIDTEIAKETILVNTKNHAELIVFYKNQLKQKENQQVREKLAQVYLDSSDPESALFTIASLNNDSRSIHSFLIEANAQLESGMVEDALETANKTYLLDDNNAEIENLLGVIYAAKRDLPQARHYFNLARKHLYSDMKIKNNLAVLDILEGKYDKANARLLHLYLNDKNDALVQSNLMLAMAKSGDLDFMEKVLSPKYTKRQISDRYIALRKTELQRNKVTPTGVKNNDENQ